MLNIVATVLSLPAILLWGAALRARGSDPSYPAGDITGPSTNLFRTLLVVYLLLFGTGLLFGIVNLWSAEAYVSGGAEAHSSTPISTRSITGPFITALQPDNIVVTTIPPMLTITGSNFTATATVLVNTEERKTRYVSDTVLLLPLTPSDVAQPASISVRVMEAGHISNARTIHVGERKFQSTFWPKLSINEETRLLVLVVFAGALGAYIHALKSVVDYIGNQTYTTSWTLFYITRPFLGTALAVVFYAVVRGGFLVGTPADVRSVNPFGVIALSGLVGMFADRATQKLAEVFDTMFRTDDKRKDRLAGFRITSDAALPDAIVGETYTAELKAEGGEQPYAWSIKSGPSWLHIDPSSGKLSGTPTTVGEKQAVIIAASDANRSTVENKFLLSVRSAANQPDAPSDASFRTVTAKQNGAQPLARCFALPSLTIRRCSHDACSSDVPSRVRLCSDKRALQKTRTQRTPSLYHRYSKWMGSSDRSLFHCPGA